MPLGHEMAGWERELDLGLSGNGSLSSLVTCDKAPAFPNPRTPPPSTWRWQGLPSTHVAVSLLRGPPFGG